MKKSTAVLSPNLGLYLDRPPLSVPPGALQDGLNFRIQQGKLSNVNLGWTAFAAFTLNGAVTLIATLHLRAGTDILIFGTPTDLYKYSTSGGGSVTYITPIYATGTASASGTAVTGSGTSWNSGSPHNAKAGDEISFGSATQNSTSATWYTIASVNSDTSITLTTSAGIVAGGVYTIRKKFAGTAAITWAHDEFINAQPNSDDRIYMTNGVDPVVSWNGTDATVSVLNSLNIVCKTLVVYKNMLLLGNLVQSGTYKPTDFVNSNVANPEDFSTGLASQFKVGGTADEIVRMARLGDYLAIYLKKVVILANFVGDPLVFIFRVASEGKGLQARDGLTIYADYHEFVGPDTLYHFDGASAKQMSNHIWREIIRTIDPVRIANIYTVLDEHRGDYIWSVPLTTDTGAGTATSPPVLAYTEHYLETVPNGAERPYSRRSFPFTASGIFARQTTVTWDTLTNIWTSYNFKWNDRFLAASFPSILVGDANGKVWELNTSQDANGSGLSSYVKFGRKPTVDGMNRGLLARVFPFVTKFSNPVVVTANMMDFAEGTTTIQGTFSYDQSLPEGLFFAPIYRVGRYVDLQFGTDGPAQPYELSGYDLLIRGGGTR